MFKTSIHGRRLFENSYSACLKLNMKHHPSLLHSSPQLFIFKVAIALARPLCWQNDKGVALDVHLVDCLQQFRKNQGMTIGDKNDTTFLKQTRMKKIHIFEEKILPSILL